MIDETAFLRRILARPADALNRGAYADWLEKRGDPRAQFLRMDPELAHLSFVAWLEKDGHLDDYVQKFPEVKREAEERKATAKLREQRRTMGDHFDPAWVAFVNTLGCRFEQFFFFNNHGKPRECQPDELPFAEPIGTRGSIVTFESDFREEKSWDQGLMPDLKLLTGLELKDCFYGAATCPVHAFVCELKSKRRSLTAADVLKSVRPRAFRSAYIKNLEATNIPFPGYHPGDGTGIQNDEVHNDFNEQHIFERRDHDNNKEIDAMSGTHGALKRYVAGGQLWYVLLHTTPEKVERFQLSRYAVLLAVGRSPSGKRLLGVISHQACYNLCD